MTLEEEIMTVKEALKEGEVKHLDNGLAQISNGLILDFNIPVVKREAESQGRLKDFYDSLKTGLLSARVPSNSFLQVVDELETIRKKLKYPIDEDYKIKLANCVIKKIADGYTELETAAIRMQNRAYPIKIK